MPTHENLTIQWILTCPPLIGMPVCLYYNMYKGDCPSGLSKAQFTQLMGQLKIHSTSSYVAACPDGVQYSDLLGLTHH
jgi:hypothetical protein